MMLKFFVFICISVCGLGQVALAETFKVAVPILTKFNPITNQVNIANYIGSHLYYPLFEVGPTGELNSRFLDLSSSKARDRKFTSYDLCLKNKVLFQDGSEVEISDFSASFQLMAQMYPHRLPLKSVKARTDRCLLVEMKYPTPSLFKKLSGIASTIIKRTQLSSDFPLGVGPYKVVGISDDKISLKYVGQSSVRFDQIEFVKISERDLLKEGAFHDINHLPTKTSLPGPTRDLNTYDVSIPKMYSVVVNLKNKSARQCAISLLSKVDWVEAYQLSVVRGGNFLPWKKNGSKKFGKLPPDCPAPSVDLYVPALYDHSVIQTALVSAGLTEKVRIKQVTNDEFGRKIFSGEEYIGLIGFDATSSVATFEGDYSTYFESFFSAKNRIVSTPNHQIRQWISKATKMDTPSIDREKLFEQAEAELIGGGFVLPVGSLKKQYRFPKGISVTAWFDYVNGIPDVSAIR